jgi:protein TonB
MNKKLIAVAALAAILCVWNLGSRAQLAPQAPFSSLVSPAECTRPEWPQEARRYEIDGVTVVNFEIGADGHVVRPAVARSSGWTILDNAALKGIARCVFPPNLEQAKNGVVFPIQYVWKFSDGPFNRPLLKAGSCQPSDRFETFQDFERRRSRSDGILVRFIVGGDGAPVRIVAEPGDQPAELVGQAVAYLQTCRFAFDPAVAGERTDTSFGRVVVKPTVN